ncbi:MAG: type II secretion system GspH family protein [Alphaproteobacteria bacterium]|nr:type II secretion system GspH family protein [Alphaproteobacteria bacterium]
MTPSDKSQYYISDNNGFTLLELSIVLIAIGLITGGIMTGSSLMHSAQLRAINEEVTQYSMAVNTFKTKYNALPGDIANAQAYFGTDVNNGNGDGMIQQILEGYYFWHHLEKAGLIGGSYTGLQGPIRNTDDVIGVNVPASKYNGAGWNIEDNLLTGTAEEYALYIDHNHYEFGSDDDSNDDDTDAPILTPADAMHIDSKYDDGRPAYGNIVARYWNNACTDASNKFDLNSDYRATDSSVQCAINYLNMF